MMESVSAVESSCGTSLEAKAEMMEKEIYNLKHELITNQLRNENK